MMKIKLLSSWQYIQPEDQEALAGIVAEAESLLPDGRVPVLWQTRNKFVLLLELQDGRKVVFKAPLRVRNAYKYFFRPSPYGREALNFYRIRQLGFPTVKFLAAGEFRTFFKLRKGFLITEYAEGFSDGFDFVPGKIQECEIPLLRDFTEKNFRLLARLHNHRMIHNGFTPGNMLYRKRQEPDADGNVLEILWIDLASCRRVRRPQNYWRWIAPDIVHYFSFFQFTDEEKLHYLQVYCRESRSGFSPEKLLKLVAACRPRR